MHVCSSLIFWFSLKVTALTPISARWRRSRLADHNCALPKSCSLAVRLTVCLLFVRKVWRMILRRQARPPSVWSRLKWDIGLFDTEKRIGLCEFGALHQYAMFTASLSSCVCFCRWLFWHLVGWEGDSLSLQHHGEPDVLGQYCQLPRPGTHVSVHVLVHYLQNQSICFIWNHFLKSCWPITRKLWTNIRHHANHYQKHR